MAINISNILTQLNTKMSSDSSSTTTELLRRVQVYNSLNDIGVLEFQSYGDLPAIDSNNIGQLAYVRASVDDSFGTFFFAKALLNDSGYYNAIDSTNSGWQKIVLNANDSDNFADIVAAAATSTQAQGSISGYTSGGIISTPGRNTIDKFPFATDANASDVGDLTQARGQLAGQSSDVSGYSSGGAQPAVSNVIDKFPFATDANATDVGNLTISRKAMHGQESDVSGYTSGGGSNNTQRLTIEKFPFAADANATDVGDLTTSQGGYSAAGQSSFVSGYTSGGSPTGGNTRIDKFPFATDANATDVGDLSVGRQQVTGQNSKDNGYTSAAESFPAGWDTIDKFPFATDANASDVGDLSQGRKLPAGQSSEESGYTSGGNVPAVNTIDKFPFVTDANATDVGDLTEARYGPAGQQV
jgi:hypothetical protein